MGIVPVRSCAQGAAQMLSCSLTLFYSPHVMVPNPCQILADTTWPGTRDLDQTRAHLCRDLIRHEQPRWQLTLYFPLLIN